ncbi:MAG: class I SAM-dependent methyltransferase [Candidatus Heimdallarchaeota archaeon]|nr:class I SAM-dependent methyltransferase [Candidatus Heimdallarchaeota archaeon]
MPQPSFWIALGIILLGFFTLVSISWPNRRGAPWVPTRLKKVRKMLLLANVQPGELVYDLGCGDGRVLVMAVREFKARAIGIEIDLIRFLWCQFLISILFLRRKVKVIYGDLFDRDLSDADVVFCYLLQSTNNKLEKKLIEELSPDARVVSNTFYFNGIPMTAMDTEYPIYTYSVGNLIREE